MNSKLTPRCQDKSGMPYVLYCPPVLLVLHHMVLLLGRLRQYNTNMQCNATHRRQFDAELRPQVSDVNVRDRLERRRAEAEVALGKCVPAARAEACVHTHIHSHTHTVTHTRARLHALTRTHTHHIESHAKSAASPYWHALAHVTAPAGARLAHKHRLSHTYVRIHTHTHTCAHTRVHITLHAQSSAGARLAHVNVVRTLAHAAMPFNTGRLASEATWLGSGRGRGTVSGVGWM